MSGLFEYPANGHVRRHGPQGYASHESYCPWLRDEFAFRCVFCLNRESMGHELGEFAIDHFLPVAFRPDLATDYDNLLYVCTGCNLAKGDWFAADPLAFLPRMIQYRRLWMDVLEVSREREPDPRAPVGVVANVANFPKRTDAP